MWVSSFWNQSTAYAGRQTSYTSYFMFDISISLGFKLLVYNVLINITTLKYIKRVIY